MTPERITLARATILTDTGRSVFDRLVAAFPEAILFWHTGDDADEVELAIYSYGDGASLDSIITLWTSPIERPTP